MRLVILAFVLAIITTGCGLKGPLYMPDEEPAPQGDQQPAS
ncbi:MAG: lipoprotein [Pseudomonadales bacterium]